MPDIFEGADAAANTSTAYTLSVGQTAQGQLGSVSDHDFYRVSLVAGQTYTVAMAGTGVNNVVDPFVRLYGSNGTTLIASDDDSLPGGNSIVTFTAATTGTYYIDAASFNNSGSGQYGVSITQGTKASLDIRMAAGVIDTDIAWTGTPGTGATVSYGYRQSAAGYTVNGSNISTFSQLTATEIAAVEQIISMFSDVSNLNFTRVNPSGYTNSATILFSNYYDPNDGAGAFAFYPGSTASGNAAGDVWLNTSSVNINSQPLGSYSFFTIIHELGHAVGLSHPGLYNAAPGVSITYANNAQFVQDSHQYTVMSYFDESATGANLGGYPDTLMVADIYALQQIYGANWSARAGNTVYGFGSNAGSIYDFSINTLPGLCIWDGGGVDTLNCSGFSQSQTINLTDGTFSNIGGRIGSVSIAVNAIIENAVGGSGADTITGNAADNALSGGGGNDNLQGGAGNDTLDGGSGNDTMAGGSGDDTYIVDSSADIVTESAGQGNDTVVTSINNYQAQANIENITAALTAGQTLTGNASANVLTGNVGNDALFGGDGSDTINGGDGNDTLDGGSGDDTMAGGSGDDTYIVDSTADIVTESAGQGNDTVVTTINNYQAQASIENITAALVAGQTLTGNASANVLTGNVGNDVLFGGEGSDTINGGDGNDTVVGYGVANQFAVEADNLSGGAGDDTIHGDAFDTLSGGTGFDVLQITNSFDMNLDLAAAGIEYVVSAFGDDTYTAASGSTAVDVYGSGGDDTITGGSGNDRLWGGVDNDVLAGNNGDDVLVGDLGADSLSGGLGNDSLYIDSSDILINGGGGFDAAYIISGGGIILDMATTDLDWVGDFANGNDFIDASATTGGVNVFAAGGIDNLVGGSGNDFMFAGTGDDTLTGNAGNDVLVGEAGADRFIGGTGSDTLCGGTEADTFVWTSGGNTDMVAGWDDGSDMLEFHQVAGLDDAGDLTIVNNNGHAEVFFGAEKLFIVQGAAGLIGSGDLLFT